MGVFVERRLKGVRAVVIGPRSYRGSVYTRYLAMFWRSITARGKFLAVETHPLFPTGVIGLIVATVRRIPLVVVAHGSDVRRTAQANPLYRWASVLVVKNAKQVVANSEDTAWHVRRLGREPVIIPPGVDLALFPPVERPEHRRVLYLGGNRPEKGVDIARRLADTLAGPGIRDLTPEQIPTLIAEHDVVLMPSQEEGFGLVAAEAIACGRWVIAGAAGALPAVVTDGLNGTIVSDGDYESALAKVPDYDPFAVSATAGRFDASEQRRRMAELYEPPAK